MRSRNIKPGFFKCEDLAECDPLARLLFAGLWGLADRDGRLEDRPKRIKAELLPFGNCDIEILLGQLVANGFIVRYQVDEHKVIQVLNFAKHQRPHHKEPSLGLPPQDAKARNVSGDAPKVPGDAQNDQARAGWPSASFGLIPSSLIPSSLIPSSGGDGEEETKEGEDQAFARFWEVCPRREEKGRALEAWKARLREGVEAEDMIVAAKNFAADCKRQERETKYIKLPANFLDAAHDFKEWLEKVPAREGKPLGLPPEMQELRQRDPSKFTTEGTKS